MEQKTISLERLEFDDHSVHTQSWVGQMKIVMDIIFNCVHIMQFSNQCLPSFAAQQKTKKKPKKICHICNVVMDSKCVRNQNGYYERNCYGIWAYAIYYDTIANF